jgi:hypothetical protein
MEIDDVIMEDQSEHAPLPLRKILTTVPTRSKVSSRRKIKANRKTTTQSHEATNTELKALRRCIEDFDES